MGLGLKLSARGRAIETVAGVDRHPALVQMDLQAVAIVLDFVKPAVANGHLRPETCKLQSNESRHFRRLRAFDRPCQEARLGSLHQLRNSQNARRGRRATTGILVNYCEFPTIKGRDPSTTNAIGLVEKVIPAQRRFRILIDHDNDGLDVSVAPFFPAYPNFARALIQGGLSVLWSHHLSGPDIAGFR
ncbi:hypothetical protein [Bradyrhizobium sp. AZCC 1578]|uniref:hypothetical protein n=1 Tax=Bradyrhizobium sp. AZCC 1578 TaxID=3117027 RepID=UPI003FA5A689